MAKTPNITIERLRSIISYDAESGVLVWNPRQDANAGWNFRNAGRVVGHRASGGYMRADVDGTAIAVHRIAWAIANGSWPDGEIDHINGDRSDNRIANLRVATRAENSWNCGISARNCSGFKGVSWDSSRKKWISSIKRAGRTKTLGRYDDPSAAYEAYRSAELSLSGDFAPSSERTVSKQEPLPCTT